MRQDSEIIQKKNFRRLANVRRSVRVLSCGVVLCLLVRDVDVGVGVRGALRDDCGALQCRTMSAHS